MDTVYICKSSEDELKRYTKENQEIVAVVVRILEDDNFREQNKIDLVLEEDGHRIWALIYGVVWIAFHEDGDDIKIVHISWKSRFKPF